MGRCQMLDTNMCFQHVIQDRLAPAKEIHEQQWLSHPPPVQSPRPFARPNVLEPRLRRPSLWVCMPCLAGSRYAAHTPSIAHSFPYPELFDHDLRR